MIAVDVAGVSEAAPVTENPGRPFQMLLLRRCQLQTRSSLSPNPSPPAPNDFPMIHSLAAKYAGGRDGGR